jgi:DNA replication protein DnaC
VTTRAPAPPPPDEGLEALLRRMRLPHIRRAAPEVLATAKAQRWDPAEVLRVLLAEEVAGRDRSALVTRRARAAFPTGKTFDAWDDALSSIPAPTQAALRTLEWIGRHENLVVCGPSGKTFLLEALGQAAVETGKHVAWFTLEGLGVLVLRHRADDSLAKAISRILRADLVIVDDIGLLPVSTDAAEGLYRLTDAAYEKRSVAISSNLRPRWIRRAHAQDPGHRHPRPAPAPRPPLPDHRRQRPPVPGPCREGSQAPGVKNPGHI